MRISIVFIYYRNTKGIFCDADYLALGPLLDNCQRIIDALKSTGRQQICRGSVIYN
uniref:DUF3800 domain-containing protein n=1 Tax=Heterorhabditis bacteriophora TaxID=37862 RepID=A0A1I7X6P1_HETBA